MENFEGIRAGNILRNVANGNSYIVTENYGDGLRAIRTINIGNPSEWEKVEWIFPESEGE